MYSENVNQPLTILKSYAQRMRSSVLKLLQKNLLAKARTFACHLFGSAVKSLSSGMKRPILQAIKH